MDKNSTSRNDFVETWLDETPMGLGSFETFDMLEYNINNLKKNNVNIIDLENNLRKVDLSQTMYYWYEKDGIVLLAVELDKRPQGLVVRLTGKNPRLNKKPPFASDLYMKILKDNQTKSLRLLSDESLSDEGKSIWDRLFGYGANISIYDRENPGQSFKTFNSKKDLDRYFKDDDSDYKRYQYVLSLSGEMLAETMGFFSIRRMRELVRGFL